MKKAFLIIFLTSLFYSILIAQDYTQTIKGKVVDIDTQIPLPGASIVIVNSDPVKGTTTNLDGYYRLEKVGYGRIDLMISYMGYETYLAREVVVGAGKEVIINAGLKESAVGLDEVEIKAVRSNNQALNSMAIIS